MSEIKLNVIDAQQTLHGMIPAGTADRLIAALSAEPETISELEVALTRFEKRIDDAGPLECFVRGSHPDVTPWDAGLLIIDLPARLIFRESTYSCPKHTGQVDYHDGEKLTDLLLPYRIPEDWRFLDSLAEYDSLCMLRAAERQRASQTDVRQVLYGRPLLEHVAGETLATLPQISEILRDELPAQPGNDCSDGESALCLDRTVRRDANCQRMHEHVAGIHTRWLGTQREDLSGRSPREVLLAKQEFIDFDLQTREMQWSVQLVGPPCLPTNSHAYRRAGFGTHEWVIYYDLVRQLIYAAVESVIPQLDPACSAESESETSDLPPDWAKLDPSKLTIEPLVSQLEKARSFFLETPNEEYSGRVPVNLIENERKRLPIALSAREMIVDDDCPICRMMANDMELSGDVGFWHLDGAHMDPDFVFSSFLTVEEWEADNRQWKEFHEEFEREWKSSQGGERQKAGEVPEAQECQAANSDWNSKELAVDGVEICTAEPC